MLVVNLLGDLFLSDVKGKIGHKFNLQQVKLQTFTGKTLTENSTCEIRSSTCKIRNSTREIRISTCEIINGTCEMKNSTYES